jgi:hypothetical protein
MEQFTEFMDKYFFYIWLAMVLWIVSNFYFRGRAAIREFGTIDASSIIYSEKSASGYSNNSWKTKGGGASKVLHIIITDTELIIKTYLFLAYIAKKYDMLHRVPLKNITSTELKKGTFSSKLHVSFTTKEGEDKEVIFMSKNNNQIKEILDRYV